MEQGTAVMERTFDTNVVSDLHKEAYGFRPGQGWWAQWRAWNDDQRQAEWDRLCQLSEASAEQERAAQERARQRWSAHILQLMGNNGIDRGSALRWDMEAMGAQGDAGYYCYLWGISYGHEEEIQRQLAGEKVG
jgi:hypothetical protein